ncbi:uncharacterized protein B0I36DRAFT_348939 [Microdochium trichocladiopsis]|uniref:C2H2-type domain-containing protein n=1 Tax=Microdochium trichocladiopsis TaxID=1682393 RepID=A0A9P8Y8Q3_9PEZI|nr:uncharacterized protein B0I36DRAFT_348939 [Microdochium trichocladiopsis]KAH7030750.1 hypothetical protein B0I36DRAFT_348939 [Microdochium trichocladiopsis]
MADLKFIMDMDDQEPDPRMNIRNHETPPGPNRGSHPSRSAPTNQEHQDSIASASLSRPVGSSSRPPTSSTAATPASSIASETGGPSRRESTASTESMDPSGYGGRGRGASSGPMRPMGSPSVVEQAVRLTPITRRVSRAKKGVPVHTCEICRPPKTFTRAEHLRRHNLSHENPRYPCMHPGCDKVFHREDLLNRHKIRHDQDDMASSQGDSTSRRASTTTADERYTHMSLTPSTMAANPSDHGHTPSMSPMGPYGREPSTSYGAGPYVNSAGQVAPRTTPPPQPQSRQRADYERQHQHMSPQNAPSSYTSSRGRHARRPSSRQVPVIQHQPPSIGNTPTTPHRRDFSIFSEAQPSSFNYMNPELAMSGQPLPTLTIPDTVPTLLAPHDSPWASSASESTFSTPSEAHARRPRAMSPQYPDWPGTFVSTLTPQTATSGVQPTEHLVTVPSAVPGTFSVLGLDGSKESALVVPPFCLGNPHMTAMALPLSILSSIPGYLKIYWERFDVQFPLLHRATFEASGGELLRCAMGAIATQFMPAKEDHVKGKQLHEFAVQELRRASYTGEPMAVDNYARVLDNLPTMQAILLCEYYARFRGRKVVVNASRVFREVYTRVIRDQTAANVAYAPVSIAPISRAQRWQQWADAEARRRLHAACFLLDVNTSVLYEQPLLKPITPTSPPIPLTAQTCQQWAASTADSWELATVSVDSTMPRGFSPCVDSVTADQLAAAPALDIAVYLAGEVLRVLPRGGREELSQPAYADLGASGELQRLFSWSPMASTYTALSYTPLHDLLAVSGDSWIFATKVLTTEQYHKHKTRLQLWCQSRQAWTAAKFAAKALCSLLALSNDDTHTATSHAVKHSHVINNNVYLNNTSAITEDSHQTSQRLSGQSPRLARTFEGVVNYKISDYWATYACALICWAVCHEAERTAMTTSVSSHARTTQGPTNALSPVDEQQPQKWLRQAAKASPDDLLCLPSAGVASSIVALARLRLQNEAIGGTNGLLNDALDVLINQVRDYVRSRAWNCVAYFSPFSPT